MEPTSTLLPMKFGVVRRGYSASGGAEAYLRRFADGLRVAGHECLLFTGEEWPAKEWPQQIRRVPGGQSPARFARALAALQPRDACDFLFSLERVEACDCYRAGDGVHAAWLQRRARTEPGFRSFFRRWQRKHREIIQLERSMFANGGARQVIANSRMVKDEIVEHYGYPANQIAVVHNGVPAAADREQMARWREEVRGQLGLGEHDYVLLFAGSGWDRKGLRWAIEAVNQAGASKPTLLVAGKGQSRRMPASDRVRYLGPTRGLGPHLAAADVFILPTLYDPFSNATLEAVAAGLPVITSAANGCSEIFAPDEASVLEDPTDAASMADAIKAWAAPERRQAVRDRLRAKGAQFSIERNIEQSLAVIRGRETRVPQSVA